MEERIREIERTASELFSQIDGKKEILFFLNMLENRQLKNRCHLLYPMESIVLEAIQIGNYRKAFLYMAFISNILNRLEKAEEDIRNKVSNYILNDSNFAHGF